MTDPKPTTDDQPDAEEADDYHGTPSGSTVDLGDTPAEEQDDDDRLLLASAILLAGCVAVGDRDIDDAVDTADRLIRAVERFRRGPTLVPFSPGGEGAGEREKKEP